MGYCFYRAIIISISNEQLKKVSFWMHNPIIFSLVFTFIIPRVIPEWCNCEFTSTINDWFWTNQNARRISLLLQCITIYKSCELLRVLWLSRFYGKPRVFSKNLLTLFTLNSFFFCHSCSQKETPKTRELKKNKEISWSYEKQVSAQCRKKWSFTSTIILESIKKQQL